MAMRIAVALAVAAALLAVPAAAAKTLTKIVAVGAGGAYVELRGLDWPSLNLSPVDVAPSGDYVLLYPLMERSVPARPGRFYPGSGVACFSWDRTVLGTCGRLAEAVGARLGGLPAVRGEPTVLRSLVRARTPARVLSSGAIAIELAFNRPQLSRRMPKRPTNCIGFRATWLGPNAATRPRRFWSCAPGLWTGGRIYPVASLSSLLA